MDNEMRKMQQEAIHRVKEMQNRAKQHLREELEPAPAEKPPSPAEESSSVPASPQPTLMEAMMQDGERTLILLLMLLLVNEDSDPGTLFGLLYLIL